MKIIPVTVISGFTSAGKTTLLKRLAAAREGQKVALITSALGAGEVDAGLCESKTKDGSIRCESREHLGLELRKVGRAKTWDVLLVESTAGSEPLPVAEAFALDDGRGTPISRYAKVDALITVIDSSTFLSDFGSSDTLTDRGLANSTTDRRHVVEVLATQVEMADILVVTNVVKSDAAHLPRVLAMLKKLNPRARLLQGSTADLPLPELLDTQLFDFEKALASIHPARYFDTPDATTDHGFVRVGYRRRRPFHPARFEALVHGDWAGVVRSKGIFWVANQPDSAGEWSQAGRVFHHAIGGSFWAATPETEWTIGENRKAEIKALWEEPYGDRRQELAFVLDGLTQETLENKLDACLLTDSEMALGLDGWRALGGDLSHGDAVFFAERGAHSHEHGDHAHEHGDHAHEHYVPVFKGHTPAGGHHSN